MVFVFYSDRKSNRPIYMQLYDYIREAVVSGRLAKNEKLPSIREASDTMGLSRTTIENAYFQLLTEGYVVSRSKSGYYAADLMEDIHGFSNQEAEIDFEVKDISREKKYFNDEVDRESFDIKLWRRLYGSILKDRYSDIFSTGDYQGEPDLRKEISRFVNLSRGAKTTPEQIVVGAGVQYLIGILAGLVRRSKSIAAFEDPGYEKAKYIFEDYGFDTKSIPVLENGIDLTKLEESGANIVYVSPSHQFPTGSLMQIPKRLELLAWAKEMDALILEDDYDSLIRHESRPVPCLQGLDSHDRVIYIGSFSKILLPSLRISYMVLPRRLLNEYESIRFRHSQSASKLEQMVLARFLEEGFMDKHLRRIKRNYKLKNSLMQKYISNNFSGQIEILSGDSGLNIVLGFCTDKGAEEIESLFAQKEISVQVIGREGENLIVSLAYSGFSIESLKQLGESASSQEGDWLDKFLRQEG